jgi:hypothetical protein
VTLTFNLRLREFVGPITLLPAVVLILASVLAGFLTDYFQPAESRTARKSF